jgi:outer membrane protein
MINKKYMNNNRLKFITGTLAGLLISCLVAGQNNAVPPALNINDSVGFQQVLQVVLSSHPMVLKAEEGIKVADAGIGLAKSGYYPNINAQAGYTRIGPVPEIPIPNVGSFQVAPYNNYIGELEVYENIYDFAKTSRNVKEEESRKEISEKNVAFVKQKLTLFAALAYYNLVFLQQALKIKDIEIANLQDHLNFITRKKETGSATQYEVLSTQVRISAAINQKSDLEASRVTHLGVLNSLLGLQVHTTLKVSNNYTLTPPVYHKDSLVDYALQHRNDMVIAMLNEKHAELHLGSVRVQNNPTLGAFGSGGVKNGYLPDLDAPTANFALGLNLKIPVFDATRHRNNVKIAYSQVEVSKQDIDQTKREISSEVNENEAKVNAAMAKIRQYELQAQQSAEALKLAKVNFDIGAITNLDLLDSQTRDSETLLELLRAKVDYTICIVRLDISLGRPVN